MKKIVYSLLLSTVLLASCTQAEDTSQSSASQDSSTTQTSTTTTTTSSSSSAEATTYYGDYKDEDLETSYKKADATTIKLSDETTVKGEGVTVDDQTVTITAAGTYVVSGELTGQLVVNAPKDATVRLIFNGVTITGDSSAAVNVQQADKVITTLAKGTTNTLKDSDTYELADGETEPDATFYSKEDLTINGTGKLVVEGNYSNGIRSKDDLTLVSGTYEVTAKNNALKGKDSVAIRDGKYTLTTTEGDAIQANNAEDDTKGYVAIDGGKFTIASGRDGIQAETNINAQNAEMNIKTADGAESTDIDTEESYKGMKAGNALVISSGTYTIDSADDSIHSNNTFELKAGTITAKSGDDGIHADSQLTISGGTVDIQQSYEGIESSVITLKDGDVSVVASDDGLNAGGGSDTDEGTGQFGADSFGGGGGAPDESDDSKSIEISGGTLHVESDGDGIDSNGNITMSGGTVTVDGPTNGGNGSLDYGGEFNLTGGTLIAAGSTGMAQSVSDSSTQATASVTFDATQEANTLFSLKDSDGNTVVTYQPSKAYQNVVVSTPDMSTTGTYTIVNGGSTDETETNGLYATGTAVSDGTETGTFTFASALSSVDQSGAAVTTGQMGGGPQ